MELMWFPSRGRGCDDGAPDLLAPELGIGIPSSVTVHGFWLKDLLEEPGPSADEKVTVAQSGKSTCSVDPEKDLRQIHWR